MAASSLLASNLISSNPKALNLSSPSPLLFSKPLGHLSFSCVSSSPFAPVSLRKGRGSELGFVRKVAAVSSGFEQDEEEEVLSGDEASFSPDLKLFVGNLPFSVNSSDLAELFDNAGTVEMVEGDMSRTSIISLGKEFETDDEAYNFYNSYARNRGFGVRKKGIEKSRTPPHEVICRKYCCNKEGVKRIVDNRQDGYAVNRRIDTRVNCPAELHIRLRISPDRSFWVVTKFVDVHSHELSSPDKVHHHFSHQSHRSKISRSIMTNLDDVGLRPSNIARVVNAMNLVEDSEQVSAQQCIDYIRHKSKNIGQEFFSIIKYFQEKAESDPEFFFATEVDQAGTLRSVFWADGRARSSYLVFSDVVVFDTTYRTNHLNLPFAPFTGVNHHQQSILFGCALLADEQRDTFVWLFKKWLKCMHGVAPHSIITDQDAQIGDAIKIVLPNTRHRFCFWHIRKHIAEHQFPLMNRFGDDFPTDFNLWFSSRDITTCEERWRLMKEKYDIDEEEDSWLLKMYRLRSHWVDAYLKDIFWAGMTTSQRSESINSFFDGYVNANTKLLEFVNQYDKAVAARRRAESQEDFMCLNCVPSCTSNPYEIQVSKIYTRKIFKLFQSEWAVVMSLFSEELKTEGQRIIYLVGDYSEPKDKWYQVSYDFCGELHVFCSCAMFETHGILCRHILCILWRKQITYIPESYILKRWRLDARQRNSVEEYGMKMFPKQGNPELPSTVRLWSLRSKFNAILEMVSDSDLHLSKLDVLLQGFQIEASNDFKTKTSNDQSSQSENNVGSSSSVLLLRDGDQITIRDPLGPVATKGRPRSASRLKSGFEESLSQKEVKQRKCGNCQQLGHYRTGCPLLVIYDKLTGKSRGFGFVTMSSVEEVEAAAQQFNGYEFKGRTLRVNSGPPPPREERPSMGFRSGGGSFDSGSRLYVGNLSWGVDNSALESLFSEQGKVMDAKVVYDRETGRSRGFGFVTYSTAEEANNAISSLDGSDLDGRTIRVTVAEARAPRREF